MSWYGPPPPIGAPPPMGFGPGPLGMRGPPPMGGMPPGGPGGPRQAIAHYTGQARRAIPSGPAVTVFVGNITERAPDAMVRHLLTTCGPVVSWKRVQGATGKLQVSQTMQCYPGDKQEFHPHNLLFRHSASVSTTILMQDYDQFDYLMSLQSPTNHWLLKLMPRLGRS